MATTLSARIPERHITTFLFDSGGLTALSKLEELLLESQRQYPSAVGLTLAISQCAAAKANLQIQVTRRALATAAAAGLPIDGHMIQSNFDEGQWPIVESIPSDEDA